jgi:hypothetical protein
MAFVTGVNGNETRLGENTIFLFPDIIEKDKKNSSLLCKLVLLHFVLKVARW